MRSRTRRLAWLTTVQGALVAGAALLVPVPAQAQGASDWPAYLFGNEHGSYNAAATAITTANAGSLSEVWHFTPPGHLGSQLYSTPIVYNGNVYFGSDNGNFYDLSESTGSVVWSHVTKQQPLLTCNWPEQPQGFVATATIAPDISSSQPTVYVAAPDGYLAMCATAASGIRQAGAFGQPEQWRFDWDRPYTRGEWLELVPTAGGHSQIHPAKLAELLAGIGAAIDAVGGSFTMHYVTIAVTAARTVTP